MNANVVLSLKEISKKYPGVLALDRVSLDFLEGEVHALLGENGAGKSTLIKAVAGAIDLDGGIINVNEQDHPKMTPHLSRSLGIEVIYQEFNLVPALSAAENIFLGDRTGKSPLVDFGTMKSKAREIFKLFNVDIDPDALVQDLSPAMQQIVEIAKRSPKTLKS
jgi:ribose transport system ATP-binding protein